jgi:hypothetical protein
MVYAKVGPTCAVAPAKEARRDGAKENGASLGSAVTSDAAASEINTKHNHAVGRLGVSYKEDVTEKDGGYDCILTWTFPDGHSEQVEASGSSKKLARANAATQMLVKQGLGGQDKEIAEECLRKLTASAREGAAYVHQVLPTMEPSGWTSLLPPVLQTVQDTRDRELIDDFILKIAKITDGRLEPEAWEGMLDVAAQTATGDEAVETLVRLSKMKISPKKFASQKQCDVFTQYRGYLSMERQAAINEALQQDFVWTKCKVEKSSGQIGIISVVPESGFMGSRREDGGGDGQDLAVLECVSRERYVGTVAGKEGGKIRIRLFHGRQAFRHVQQQEKVHLGLVDESDVSHERMVMALAQSCGYRVTASKNGFNKWLGHLLYDVPSKDAIPAELSSSEKDAMKTTLENDAGRPAGMDKIERSGLTSAQERALNAALSQHISLIQGPPGTGKTFIASRIVEVWRSVLKQRVLAVADSNAAADNLAEALESRGVECVRIGRMARYDGGPASRLPEYRKLIAAVGSGERGKEVYLRTKLERACVERFPVIVCTCIGAGHEALDGAEFPCVVIDECTQAVLPSTLVPLMRGAQRVVLIGDHMQLPPTILSTQARDDGYAMSLFEKLVLAHGEWSIMLDVQRRMHPCIAAFPGRAFYGDRIRSADCTWDEAFIDGFKWPNGNRVVCVNSNGWEERRGVSSINRDEAYAVAALIPRIQLEQAEIGIITPYLAQKNMILELLAKHHNIHDIKVDTVDGFQGSERELIVYSCVRSNERGALGFLSDYRRLNVAITRARKGLVVLGNIATLESYGEETAFGQYDDRRYWRQWIKWCRQMDLVREIKDLQL